MIRRLAAAALALFTPILASAQHFHHHVESALEDDRRSSPCEKKYAEPVLDASIRKVPWKVSTTSPQAQAFFEQGMTLLYGFNYEGAMQNFGKAKELDPSLAMASWGIALAAGPNINISMDEPCGKVAHRESDHALALAEAQYRQGKITELEYALVRALPPRYVKAQIEAVDYAVAMRPVWARFRPDPNVSALYAESLMDLRPWALFNVAKQPAIDTNVILNVLRQSVAAHPKAVGANHYWIHAVEAGPNPGAAKASADLLRAAVPGSGHLLHMPSHTYQLIGDYAAAFEVNGPAIVVDNKQYGVACAGTYEEYTENPACLQFYYGHYNPHNLFFRSVAGLFLGKRTAALADARATAAHVKRFVVNEPTLQRYLTAPLSVLAANHAWDAALQEPEPPESCYIQPPFTIPSGCHIVRSMWFWARGVAYAAKGNAGEAKKAYKGSVDEQALIGKTGPTGWGNNTAAAVLSIANQNLLARISWAEGKREAAIEHLKLGVTAEDALVYDEPPQWFHPTRQSLGGAYLAVKDYHAARLTFLDDLQRHPRNGRSLYGLYRALKELGDPTWHEVQQQYETAWKLADYRMTDGELW
jgi:tetratricopeptide (TPR) repeat protein